MTKTEKNLMPFDGRKRRNITAVIAAVMCTLLLFLPDLSQEPIRKDAAIETIMNCFASKGERVSADAVRDWIAEFRDRYGETEAGSRIVAERVACRYR